MTRTKQEFVEWANDILKNAGVGCYDCGTPWFTFEIDSEGEVCGVDYNDSITAEDWEELTEEDVQAIAATYTDAS